MRNTSVVIDTTQSLKRFLRSTMPVMKDASEKSDKPQLTKPPLTTKSMRAFVDHTSGWNTTGTTTPLDNLLISISMSEITDKNVAVRETNTTVSPYLIRRHSGAVQLY